MTSLSLEDTATLKQLKQLHDEELIDADTLQKLRQPILDKMLRQVQQAGGVLPKRVNGTPSSANMSADSPRDSCSSDVSSPEHAAPPSINAKTVLHAQMKAEVSKGKKLKRHHEPLASTGKQVSLFNFGVVQKREMADGSMIIINDDGNAFIPEQHEPSLSCDICQRTFSWPGSCIGSAQEDPHCSKALEYFEASGGH